MDSLTAAEINDVQSRWAENGRPGMSGMGQTPGTGVLATGPSWWDSTMYAITGDVSYLGLKTPTAAQLAQEAKATSDVAAAVRAKAQAEKAAQEKSALEKSIQTSERKRAEVVKEEAVVKAVIGTAAAQDAFKDCVIQNPFSDTDAQKCFEAWLATQEKLKPKTTPGAPAPTPTSTPAPTPGGLTIPNWAPWALMGGLGVILLVATVRR